MKTIEFETNYTVGQVAQLFNNAKAMLTEQQFNDWVNDFWTMFSQTGGTRI